MDIQLLNDRIDGLTKRIGQLRSTERIMLAISGRGLAGRAAGAETCGRVSTWCTVCRRCSGVVPQQPPTNPTANSSTISRSDRAIGSGSSGKEASPLTLIGMPAFGMIATGLVLYSPR